MGTGTVIMLPVLRTVGFYYFGGCARRLHPSVAVRYDPEVGWQSCCLSGFSRSLSAVRGARTVTSGVRRSARPRCHASPLGPPRPGLRPVDRSPLSTVATTLRREDRHVGTIRDFRDGGPSHGRLSSEGSSEHPDRRRPPATPRVCPPVVRVSVGSALGQFARTRATGSNHSGPIRLYGQFPERQRRRTAGVQHG